MTFKNFIQNIFSIKNVDYHKQITLIGIKLKIKTISLTLKKFEVKLDEHTWRTQNKVEEVKAYVLASKSHGYLEKYKGLYKGKDVVILGCGPSLKNFKPIKDAIYLGVNRAYKFESKNLDYLFVADNFPEGMDDFANYNRKSCKKFFVYLPYDFEHKVHAMDLLRIPHEKIIANPNLESRIPQDISYEPFGSYGRVSTTLGALQFALYTLPKRIFIVGCDCTKGNIYRKEPTPVNPSDSYEYQLYGWGLIKEDIQNFYPEIEVVSVNPIGLKGYFKDVYTQSFIDEHPELKDVHIEIINEEGLCKNL